jgi:hypothetical protein
MFRLRTHGARQQVWRVGLEQQAVCRDLGYQLAQMQPAALVADPPGDADVAVQREVVAQRRGAVGEAVHDDAGHAVTVAFQQLQEVSVGVALVQEHRHAQVDGDLQLALERQQLCIAR